MAGNLGGIEEVGFEATPAHVAPRQLLAALPLRERATPDSQQKRRSEGADAPHAFELAVIRTLPSPARGEGTITAIGARRTAQ
jgi:hypothetical protein